MEVQFVYVAFILMVFCCWNCVKSQFEEGFSCRKFTPLPLDLKDMSGVWYELAHVPRSDLMTCFNITVPAMADEELKLKVEYISHVKKQPEVFNEEIAYPWNNLTRHSTFTKEYGDAKIEVTYKIVYNDNQKVFVCGYVGISKMPFVKLFARMKDIDPAMKKQLEQRIAETMPWTELTWTEQSSCNKCARVKISQVIRIMALFIASSLRMSSAVIYRCQF